MPPKDASHVFFFSYASENKDAQLETFFEDLCIEVAPYTRWAPKDPRVSFRDDNNLPLMEEWRPALLRGLQTAAVLVCVTSRAYFEKRFCGQEYYIFDQRRRQGLADGQSLPAVVLPVIWAPSPPELFPEAMDRVQWRDGDMPALYKTKGLRYLKTLAPEEYRRCVVAFAEAISDAWQKYPRVVESPDIAGFDNIPNPFRGAPFEEASGPGGWISGPGVANFVYAASSGGDLPQPRYGAKANQWRPYLPPHEKTIAEMARGVARAKALKYREIPVDEYFRIELKGASDRKNLTVVVADPRTLSLVEHDAVKAFDEDPWEGTAVLVPDKPDTWEQNKGAVSGAFGIRSLGQTRPFQAPIKELEEFEPLLDVTLTNLRAAVTRVEAEKKPKTDDPPTQVLGSSGTPS